MAKIDITAIDGYAEMTAEEKVAILEAFEYNDNKSELERYKNATSKANSEVAEWKRKHNALLSEEEQKKQATEEELNNLRNIVKTMEKEKQIAKNKAEFISLGYEDELATATAEALYANDAEKVFLNHRKFLETHDKVLKASLLKSTPTPPAGDGGDTMTLEKLKKMTAQERYEFSIQNPDEYKKIYGGQ